MTIETNMPTLLDTIELAAALGIPKRTLERLRTKGSGPKFVLLGSKVFYAEHDVNAWLDELEAAGARNER